VHLSRIFFPAVLFLVVLIVACGGDGGDSGDSQEPSGDTEVRLLEAALAVGEGESVSTQGYLFGDADGSMRLCSFKFPATPPQCGGTVVEIFGMDPDTVPDVQSTQDQGEVKTLIWTEYEITVTGVRSPEGLDEVRLLGGGTK
jgi:hypothetical protein